MSEPKSTNIHWHEGNVTRDERWESLGIKGVTLWFTGNFISLFLCSLVSIHVSF